jgi:hypothetical protein
MATGVGCSIGAMATGAIAVPGYESLLVDPDEALFYLRDTRALWRDMNDAGRRDLATAIYERITATSQGITEVKLTREAERHGMALALPERVFLARTLLYLTGNNALSVPP